MAVIVEKSEMMGWTEENIQSVPEVIGVYTLRSDTTLDSILYIGMAEKLRERLLYHFRSDRFGEVNFFDWYRTQTLSDASRLETTWISRYRPPFNG